MLFITIFFTLFTFITTVNAEETKTPIISGYTFGHQSNILKENRRYMVSLPELYYANNYDYPTLYIIDSDFQFQHTSAIVTNLTRMGKIPPMIVIGIATQGQQDYIYQTTWKAESNSDYGGATLFSQYINNELLPIIQKKYRTNSKKVLAGYSLGGSFTNFVMMQKESQFNAYLAMSPAVWFDDYSLAKSLPKYLSSSSHPLPEFFISVANEKGMGVDKLVVALKNKVVKKQKKNKETQWHWQFKSYPNETHFSTALPAFYDALVFLSPDFYFDPQDMMKLKNYSKVLDIFEQKKSSWTGFRFGWLQSYQLAKYMFWSKQLDKVDDFLLAIKQKFPESLVEVTVQVAKGFNTKKNPKQARKLLLSIKELAINNAMWHREMSLSFTELKQIALAEEHQKIALSIAKKQQLPTWFVWELQ